jgi:hypothetical protein
MCCNFLTMRGVAEFAHLGDVSQLPQGFANTL